MQLLQEQLIWIEPIYLHLDPGRESPVPEYTETGASAILLHALP